MNITMKTIHAAIGACFVALAANAHAQSTSSVALWGVLDAGVTYVTNQNGGHGVAMDNGIASSNLWGMRGTEDLGGGNRAVFEPIDQFNLGTGAIFPTNGGGLFGRNAYVGLQSDRFASASSPSASNTIS